MTGRSTPPDRLRRQARPTSAEPRSGRVQSLERALKLLKTLSAATEGMTLSELALVVGLPASTVHRLLTTLEAERFVRFDPAEATWRIGVEAFRVGNAFARSRDLVAIARPYLRRLMEDTGETANLYLAVDGEAVCMAQVECRQMMRAIARPGGRVAMHASGVGKAILAGLPSEEVHAVLRRHGLPKLTERTIDTPRKLEAELAAIRSRGWALDDEEHALGLRCVAAAILDEHGRPAGAISVSGPSVRIPDGRLPELAAAVCRTARELTRAIGGDEPARASSERG
ncbi:MAG: IclR family transcriptional regulator C-terminal domain-containing protein [Geminicoccaceae bacterium]|nr:IclR family transcriptional regulator C-terminal domain-containing protein [Geminicoccaceae bacterium]